MRHLQRLWAAIKGSERQMDLQGRSMCVRAVARRKQGRKNRSQQRSIVPHMDLRTHFVELPRARGVSVCGAVYADR